MRRAWLFAFLVMSLWGQESSGPRFAGIWEARSGQRVVCALKIESETSLKVSDLGCRISVDDEGNLTDSGPLESPGEKPLSKVAIRDGVLFFQIDADPEEDEPVVIRAQLKLTGEREAELTFIDFPVPVKPIRFQKQ